MEARLVVLLAVLGVARSVVLISSPNITNIFVDGHNRRRLLLAQGAVEGQPAASKMTYVTWNDKLSESASNWAVELMLKKEFRHNPHLTDAGENLFGSSTSDSHYNVLDYNPDAALECWWSEHKKYNFGDKFSGTNGHYIQMASVFVARIGCALGMYEKDHNNNFLVVCHYGYEFGPGKSPYEPGPASNQLVCHDNNSTSCANNKATRPAGQPTFTQIISLFLTMTISLNVIF